MGGCSSCGKNAAARVGVTLNTAIVFGEPLPDVFRVRVTGDIPGILTGAIKYVRGTGVQQLIDDGKVVVLAGGSRPLPPKPNGTTLYYVGNIGYSDIGTARVRSGQSGDEIVVRTFGS